MKKAVITVTKNTTDKCFKSICDGFLSKYGQCEFKRLNCDGIIGGFVADIDGEIVDASVKTQLERMRKHLSESR